MPKVLNTLASYMAAAAPVPFVDPPLCEPSLPVGELPEADLLPVGDDPPELEEEDPEEEEPGAGRPLD